ncbi:TRC40/GET3/ArsA family transport-energizing ATPase [soil metagenome]
MLLTRPVLLLGGKGGVGKTTVAAAAALELAGRGQRVLLASTDPAHSTSDLLGTAIGPEPTSVAPGLDVVEVDAAAAVGRLVDAVKEDVVSRVSREVLPAVHRHLDLARHSPGTVESAMLDALVDLLDLVPGTYDRLVIDTAPTGHTLRLLALPQVVGDWVGGLVKVRQRASGMERILRNMAGRDGPAEDPLLGRLRARQERYAAARTHLAQDAAVWPVLVPERLPIEETARAVQTLRGAGLHVAGLVVNRVLPAEADGVFLAARRKQQTEHLAEISMRFADLPQVEVPQQSRDVVGVEGLGPIRAALQAAID